MFADSHLKQKKKKFTNEQQHQFFFFFFFQTFKFYKQNTNNFNINRNTLKTELSYKMGNSESVQRNLTTAQYVSAPIFGTFLATHLINHLTLHFGIDFAQNLQNTFRLFYQNPVIEPILLAGALVHVVASYTKVYLRYLRHKKFDSLFFFFFFFQINQ